MPQAAGWQAGRQAETEPSGGPKPRPGVKGLGDSCLVSVALLPICFSCVICPATRSLRKWSKGSFLYQKLKPILSLCCQPLALNWSWVYMEGSVSQFCRLVSKPNVRLQQNCSTSHPHTVADLHCQAQTSTLLFSNTKYACIEFI